MARTPVGDEFEQVREQGFRRHRMERRVDIVVHDRQQRLQRTGRVGRQRIGDFALAFQAMRNQVLDFSPGIADQRAMPGSEMLELIAEHALERSDVMRHVAGRRDNHDR